MADSVAWEDINKHIKKTTDISRCHHHWFTFPAKWRQRNERRNSKRIRRHFFLLAEENFIAAQPIRRTTDRDLGRGTSSVWKFRSRCPRRHSWGNHWSRREMSAVFLGYRFGLWSFRMQRVKNKTRNCLMPPGTRSYKTIRFVLQAYR